mgnify:CR=1 FL=1
MGYFERAAVKRVNIVELVEGKINTMKKHQYNIEDITLSIIYAFYLNYHNKQTNIQLLLFSASTSENTTDRIKQEVEHLLLALSLLICGHICGSFDL